MLDQAVSSASNVVVFVLLARDSEPVALGRYSLIFASIVTLSGAIRSATSEVLSVAPAVSVTGRRYNRVDTELSAGLALAMAAAFPVVFVALAANNIELAAAASMLPLISMLETSRYASYSHGDPRVPIAGNLLWLVTPILGYIGGLRDGRLFLCWPLGGAAAGILVLLVTRPYLEVSRMPANLRVHQHLRFDFVGDFLSTSFSNQLLLPLVAWFGSLGTAGGMRIVLSAFGPVNTVFSGIQSAAVPRFVQRRSRSSFKPLQSSARIAALMIFVVGCVCSLVRGDPGGVVSGVLGNGYGVARSGVVPMGLLLSCSAVIGASNVALRAEHQTRLALRLRAVTIPFRLVPPCVAAALGGGLQTVLFASASGTALASILWIGALVSRVSNTLMNAPA